MTESPSHSSGFLLADQPSVVMIVIGCLIVLYVSVRFRRRSRDRLKKELSKLPPSNRDQPWL